MTPALLSLDEICDRAQRHAFRLDDIPFARGVDWSLPFFPTSHLPLAFTSGWSLLSEEERLVANQWYGLALSEQFIFLEDAFLNTAMKALLRERRAKLAPPLVRAIEIFIEEETKHAEMFRRTLREAKPEWYADTDRHFYTPGLGAQLVQKVLDAAPVGFVAWPWMGMILEEKTVAYYRAYERAERDGEILDPLHRAIHTQHFLEETRHVQIEQHLVAELWDGAPGWWRAVNARALVSILRRYTRPRRRSVHANIMRALCVRFPRLAPMERALVDGVRALAHDETFQREIYGRETIPRSFALFDRYDELRVVGDVAPAYAEHLAARSA